MVKLPSKSASKSANKPRTAYVCNQCGADYVKWQGQCEACGAWDALSEIVLESAAQAKSPASRRSGWAGKLDAPQITSLADVRTDAQARTSTLSPAQPMHCLRMARKACRAACSAGAGHSSPASVASRQAQRGHSSSAQARTALADAP